MGMVRTALFRRCVCLGILFAAVGLAGCSPMTALQVRERTSVVDGAPDPQRIAELTRHPMTVGAEESYALLVDLLFSEGCLIESADKASGIVVARQVLPLEMASVIPVAGEIRRMSFRVAPAGLTSEVDLIIYVSRQWYSNDTASFSTEELGLSTDPALYREWFDKLDRAVPR